MEPTTNNSESSSPFSNSSNDIKPAQSPTQSSPVNPVSPSPKPLDTTPAFMGMNAPTSYNPAPKPNPTTIPTPTPAPVAPKPFTPSQASGISAQATQPRVAKVEFEKDSFTPTNNAFTPTETQHSSHKMLWFMILFTILFLALIGGVTYWYLKVYSPQMLGDQATTTTETTPAPAQTFPNAIHPMTNTTPSTPVKPTTSSKNKIKVQAATPFSSADQDKVSAYIKANIDSLSPYKSSAGYTVTDITFDGPDRAIVSYGNDTNHYSAVAVSYIDSSGNVKVTSFTILEK